MCKIFSPDTSPTEHRLTCGKYKLLRKAIISFCGEISKARAFQAMNIPKEEIKMAVAKVSEDMWFLARFWRGVTVLESLHGSSSEGEIR